MFMKNITCALVAILISINCIGQSLWDVSKPDKTFQFGIETGINYASTSHDNASASKSGIQTGIIFDYNIIKSLSLSSGLFYTQNGFTSMYGDATMHYVKVPLYFSWRFETITHVLFHVNVGTYVSYGIGGSIQYEPTFTNIYYFHQDCFGDQGFFKDYDAGMTVGGFIQVKDVKLGIGYDLGLVNIADVYGEFHNRNISIKLGYMF